METSDSEPNKEENFQIKILNFENFDDFKLDILKLEEQCFEPILRDNEQGLYDALKMKSALCFGMYNETKLVGIYYLTLLDELNKEFFDKYLLSCWNPNVYKDYGKNNTYYIHIVAVSPEYQGKGIGKKLNQFTLDYLKKLNIKNVLIHAHEGSMLNIIKRCGGVELDKLENLVNTGQDYYLCEIIL